MAKNKHNNNKKKKDCFSGTDRWRPGSVIPIGFCSRPDWYPAVVTAANNWNVRFGYVSLSPVECVAQGQYGISITEGRVLDGGEPHHGATYPERDGDGYFVRGNITVNTIDFYPRDQVTAGDPSLIAHETGHALGAGHLFSGDDGCMTRPPLPGDPAYPGQLTLSILNSQYAAPEICHKKKG